MLQTRKSRVIFVTPTTSYEISLSKDQLLGGIEIEEHIVAEVVCLNSNYKLFQLLFEGEKNLITNISFFHHILGAKS